MGLAAKIVKQSSHLSNCPNFQGQFWLRGAGCEPLAGKSTLNRLEHAPDGRCGHYHNIFAISGEAFYARAELSQM